MLRSFRLHTVVASPRNHPSSEQRTRDAVVLTRCRGIVPLLLIAVLGGLTACRGGFHVEKFAGDTNALYKAGVQQLALKHWENAVMVFEKLSTDLPARDTLLPRVQFDLGRARSGNLEHLLAAQAFTKLSENYPEDSLADDAMYESAREYQKLWRSPELDSQYGTTAQATFRTLVAVYPDSPKRKDAEVQLAALEEMFATKEYLAGYYYLRRKAYDPAILYFKVVVNTYPESLRAKDAYLRMVESYRVIRYREEAADACTALRKRFASDPEVQKTCGAQSAAADSAAAATPRVTPPPAPTAGRRRKP
jgi:outer membrane protein assembly factor BamD